MRPLRALVALSCLAVGLVLGVLNADPVAVDLGVFEIRASLGVVLLCTLLAGVLLGGLAIVLSVVLPLRRALARTNGSNLDSPPATPSTAEPSTALQALTTPSSASTLPES